MLEGQGKLNDLVQPGGPPEAFFGVVQKVREWLRRELRMKPRECSPRQGDLLLFRQIVSERYHEYEIENIRSFTDGTSFCFISNGEERYTIRLDDRGWKLVKLV